jgi:hypothetical protein
MIATVKLDDQLLEEAQSYIGSIEQSELMEQALRALIEHESAKQWTDRQGLYRTLRPESVTSA